MRETVLVVDISKRLKVCLPQLLSLLAPVVGITKQLLFRKAIGERIGNQLVAIDVGMDVVRKPLLAGYSVRASLLDQLSYIDQGYAMAACHLLDRLVHGLQHAQGTDVLFFGRKKI